MCGISAIASHQPVSTKLLESLKNLEYRGYDSCGMALATDNQLVIRKNVGSVNEVDSIEHFEEMTGELGIAHTRWATHGGVTSENSHPHFSNDKQFVIVHNGIFSNYHTIQRELKDKGYNFLSQTDTEVFSNLLQDEFSKVDSVEDAFCNALDRLEGSFAIAMITTHHRDTVYAARKDSPLVVGVDDGTNYISSDMNAFISETRDTILLDDYEYVMMTNESCEIKRLSDRKPVSKQVISIQWDKATAQKGGFSHYMLKEIFDQPQTVRTTLAISETEIETIAEKCLSKKQTFCVGVGTTYYVAMVGTYLFSKFAGIYAPSVSADEYPSLVPVNKDHHVLFLSQSGETYDTRMAIRAAKENNAATSAIVNVVGSSISREVDDCIFQGSGPEICVVSTKAALSQMMILWQIVLRTSVMNKSLTQDQADQYRENLFDFSRIIEQVVNEESGFIRNLANETCHINNWLFMGRDIYLPIALESALKMKEVTYLHAEGLPAGFLKHGTLAMVDETMYSLFFLPLQTEGELYHSTLASIEEVKARRGKVIGFCTEDNEELKELLDHHFVIPKTAPELTPFIELVIAQLFSYYSALHLGLNIDKPRNLAKSVTVA
jgi:glutamine---fructose-6-phosphate transaminase (isomerizing)